MRDKDEEKCGKCLGRDRDFRRWLKTRYRLWMRNEIKGPSWSNRWRRHGMSTRSCWN